MTDTLRVLADELKGSGEHFAGSLYNEEGQLILRASEAIISLLDRIARLEGALKPFAEIEFNQYERDDGPAFIEGINQKLPTIADLRTARAALASASQETEKPAPQLSETGQVD